MPITAIVQLLITFGPAGVQLIDKLIAKFETGGDITSAEWAELRTAALQSAQDRMILVLT